MVKGNYLTLPRPKPESYKTKHLDHQNVELAYNNVGVIL
jgi:hypothetical protein